MPLAAEFVSNFSTTTHEHLAIYMTIHSVILAQYCTPYYELINNYLDFPYK